MWEDYNGPTLHLFGPPALLTWFASSPNTADPTSCPRCGRGRVALLSSAAGYRVQVPYFAFRALAARRVR